MAYLLICTLVLFAVAIAVVELETRVSETDTFIATWQLLDFKIRNVLAQRVWSLYSTFLICIAVICLLLVCCNVFVASKEKQFLG